MTVRMAVDLSQVGLLTSVFLYQEYLITDMGRWLYFPEHNDSVYTLKLQATTTENGIYDVLYPMR